MNGVLSIVLLAAMAAGRPIIPPRRLRPAANPAPQAANFTLTATPATITFNTTNNPSTTPVVAGSQAATITWSTLAIFDGSNWTLKVQANSPTFTNCPLVPTSAVTVSCTAASIGGIGGTAVCSSPFPLSTTSLQVAGGSVGNLFTYNYSVTINFTLADSWKYIAEQNPACSLTLTYNANVP